MEYIVERMIERPVPRKPYVDGLHVFGCGENFLEQRRKFTDSVVEVVAIIEN